MNRLWYGYLNRHPQRLDGSRYAMLNLNALFLRGAYEVRCFPGALHAGKVKAAILLCLAIAAKCLNGRAASHRKRIPDGKSDKYRWRCVMLNLKMIGDEFKSARKHLLANLAGDSAWKNGRPKPKDNDVASPATAQSMITQPKQTQEEMV